MSHIKKIEAVTQTHAYQMYSELIGAAMVRLVMGDGSALSEVTDLQHEQAQLVRDAVEKTL